jgi:hypothetical protein
MHQRFASLDNATGIVISCMKTGSEKRMNEYKNLFEIYVLSLLMLVMLIAFGFLVSHR